MGKYRGAHQPDHGDLGEPPEGERSYPPPPPHITIRGAELKTGPYTEAPVCDDCGHTRPFPISPHFRVPAPPYTAGGVCPQCGGTYSWVVGRWRTQLKRKTGFFSGTRIDVISKHFIKGRGQ